MQHARLSPTQRSARATPSRDRTLGVMQPEEIITATLRRIHDNTQGVRSQTSVHTPIVTERLGPEGSNPLRRAPTRGPAVLTCLGGGLFSVRTSPVTGEPFPRSSSSFIRTSWLHLIYVFFVFVIVAAPFFSGCSPERCGCLLP
jgi:hypothetical protein